MFEFNEKSGESFHDQGRIRSDYVFKHVAPVNREKLEKLNQLQKNVNWEIEKERREFLHQLNPLISDWSDQLPNLRDIFRPQEIERLIYDSINIYLDGHPYNDAEVRFVNFVARTGYKDEPEIDEYGKPLLHRTTPIHYTARWLNPCLVTVINELFKVYNRYDVNCIDNRGVTHFHVACMFGCDHVVEKFLEVGQDPNVLAQQTGNSSLQLALTYYCETTVRLLLRYGGNPNLTNKRGSTALHTICMHTFDDNFVEMLFELSNEKYQPVQVNALDIFGNTPLHLALRHNNREKTESLLRRGAHPNWANIGGFTPLHIICKNIYDDDLAKFFFAINNDMQQTVHIDARDKWGQTPLQWAVANLLPNTVDFLLNNGADLSNFIFPTESYFGKRFKPCVRLFQFKFRIASGALAVVDHLEKKGYQLDRSDALIIMKLFAEHRLFEKSMKLEKYGHEDDEEFTGIAKKIMINSDLSVYDLIQLRPEEAAKRLTFSDFFKFAQSQCLCLLPEKHRDKCILHLCEIISRKFFRSWALDCFYELIHFRLPILCCRMIIEELMNEDLYNICLANTLTFD